MTEFATDLLRRLEGGFGGKKLAAGVRAEYVEYLDRIGEERAERAVVLAMRTLKYLPRIAELVELDLASATHPSTPPPAPRPLVLADPPISALELDYDGVPDEFRPVAVDRPASPEYAAYWRDRIRSTLGAVPVELPLGAVVETLDLPELAPDELERDDLEPF